ncbi:MAG TPA: alpha/beta hydrolase [Solirubrobacterales bacterium]
MKRTSVDVLTPDGRRLAVEVAGPQDGEVVVFHTGTPSAGSLFAPLLEAGAERGLRHVSYSRPGYGDSDRQPGRTIADCTHDVAAIADALGVERFYTTGHSGGGPHALACAALLPDRVNSATTTAGVAPFDAEGLDWLAGMGQENLDEFAAQQAGDSELQAFLEDSAEELRSLTGEQVLAALGDLISEADRAVLTGEFAEHMAASLREALRTGIWGWFDDDKATCAGWGFDLAKIDVPVTIWQGEEDRMVPFVHGKWLAAHVSGAKARLLPDQGHLSLELGSYGDVLDDLVASRV